ncbi:MAG: SLC13 family permease [Chloroflexota bacterium]
MNIFPIIILGIVFILIAVRQLGNIRFQIWQIMLFGALAVLFTGRITPAGALRAINWDVMLFLFGMFVIGQALEESGLLSYLSSKVFSRIKSLDVLILCVLFVIGLLSAFLMNDTLAIIGTPVVLSLAKKGNMRPRVLLFALAFAITIGSVMSPIGNPQNLVIALHGGVANPFITFFRFLALPTVINLLVAYVILRLFYWKHFNNGLLPHQPETIKNNGLATFSKISLILLFMLVLFRITTVFLGLPIDFKLTYIALISALPVVLLSPRRFSIIGRIDWFTLIFFAAMFVLMESVWNTGFFQSAINATPWSFTSTGVILGISITLSQFISNVPLVVLYLPMLLQMGASVKEMMVLAAGSTIAGNLSILGAASNVIIIQNAEKKAGETLRFLEFVRIGVPLTIANTLIYWLFFNW